MLQDGTSCSISLCSELSNEKGLNCWHQRLGAIEQLLMSNCNFKG